MRTLTLAASAGLVHITGADGEHIRLAPELAEQIAAELPRKAAQARVLARDETALIARMADDLRALGCVWVVFDENIGWWDKGGKPLTLLAGYTASTRSLYYDLIEPLEADKIQ